MLGVVGIDPGGTTAVAFVRDGRVQWYKEFNVTREADLNETLVLLAHLLQSVRTLNPMIAVENFIGAGPRSHEAAWTLQILGFVRGYTRLCGMDVVVQPPQARLSSVERAKTALADYAVSGKMQRAYSDHVVAALAHALTVEESFTKGAKHVPVQGVSGNKRPRGRDNVRQA